MQAASNKAKWDSAKWANAYRGRWGEVLQLAMQRTCMLVSMFVYSQCLLQQQMTLVTRLRVSTVLS